MLKGVAVQPDPIASIQDFRAPTTVAVVLFFACFCFFDEHLRSPIMTQDLLELYFQFHKRNHNAFLI